MLLCKGLIQHIFSPEFEFNALSIFILSGSCGLTIDRSIDMCHNQTYAVVVTRWFFGGEHARIQQPFVVMNARAVFYREFITTKRCCIRACSPPTNHLVTTTAYVSACFNCRNIYVIFIYNITYISNRESSRIFICSVSSNSMQMDNRHAHHANAQPVIVDSLFNRRAKLGTKNKYNFLEV